MSDPDIERLDTDYDVISMPPMEYQIVVGNAKDIYDLQDDFLKALNSIRDENIEPYHWYMNKELYDSLRPTGTIAATHILGRPITFSAAVDNRVILFAPPNKFVKRGYEVRDSGKRQEFVTGSRRDTRVGKGRYDLLSPIAIRRIAKVYEGGAAKYGDRNWEKGQPLSRYLDSALRHLFQVLEGNRDEDHAAQSAWNLMAFIHTEERISAGKLPKELDDIGWTEKS